MGVFPREQRKQAKPPGMAPGRLFCVLALLFFPGIARAADILVLLSARTPAYDEAARAFGQQLEGLSPGTGSKRVDAVSVSTVSLSEPEAEPGLQRLLSSRPPDLVVAFGSRAYQAVRTHAGVPLVFLLVPGVPEREPRRTNSAGVAMDVAPEDALRALRELAPEVRRVGVVYTPERSSALVAEAGLVARRLGLALVERPVRTAAEAPAALRALRGAADALWMLPDPLYAARENVETAILFSVEQRAPVLTFAERYLEMGAALAVSFDPGALGRQGAALARKVLSGAETSSLPLARPERPVVKVNPGVAKKLGLAQAGTR